MAHWLDFPVVSAPSPDDRSKTVWYSVSDDFVDNNALIKRRTPVLQLWAHVAGQLPPINNASRILKAPLSTSLCTLHDCVACFRGVNRPYDDDDHGSTVYVYVLNPAVSVAYDPDMVSVAKAVAVPAGVVATVQVKPMESLQIGGKDICGKITRIEFVPGVGSNPILPANHSDRYSERLWR